MLCYCTATELGINTCQLVKAGKCGRQIQHFWQQQSLYPNFSNYSY